MEDALPDDGAFVAVICDADFADGELFSFSFFTVAIFSGILLGNTVHYRVVIMRRRTQQTVHTDPLFSSLSCIPMAAYSRLSYYRFIFNLYQKAGRRVNRGLGFRRMSVRYRMCRLPAARRLRIAQSHIASHIFR